MKGNLATQAMSYPLFHLDTIQGNPLEVARACNTFHLFNIPFFAGFLIQHDGIKSGSGHIVLTLRWDEQFRFSQLFHY
jgi:hypothetical protein